LSAEADALSVSIVAVALNAPSVQRERVALLTPMNRLSSQDDDDDDDADVDEDEDALHDDEDQHLPVGRMSTDIQSTDHSRGQSAAIDKIPSIESIPAKATAKPRITIMRPHRPPRVASLCLGIDHFSGLTDLGNCIGDARAIATEMVAIPSTSVLVHLLEDVDRPNMFSALDAFGNHLEEHSQSLEVVVVYLASHGFQYGSKLYMATSDIAFVSSDNSDMFQVSAAALEMWLQQHAISVDAMMACVRCRYTGPLVFVFDACRTAPIPGLAVVPSEMVNSISYMTNTLVCLSTSVGRPAMDNEAADAIHSPFCSALLGSLFRVGASLVSAINTACLSMQAGLNQRPVMASVQFRDLRLVPNFCLVVVVDFGSASFSATTLLLQLERLQKRHGLRCEDMAVVHAGAPHADVAAHLERRSIALLCWSGTSVALMDAREVDCDEVVPRLFGMWMRCCERCDT
jgi:hypothetical protein